MAPSATEFMTQVIDPIKEKAAPDSGHISTEATGAIPVPGTKHKDPLKPTGLLDKYGHFDVTPIIGREFVDVDMAEWLRAPNSDDLIRELAITSEQGLSTTPKTLE